MQSGRVIMTLVLAAGVAWPALAAEGHCVLAARSGLQVWLVDEVGQRVSDARTAAVNGATAEHDWAETGESGVADFQRGVGDYRLEVGTGVPWKRVAGVPC